MYVGVCALSLIIEAHLHRRMIISSDYIRLSLLLVNYIRHPMQPDEQDPKHIWGCALNNIAVWRGVGCNNLQHHIINIVHHEEKEEVKLQDSIRKGGR